MAAAASRCSSSQNFPTAFTAVGRLSLNNPPALGAQTMEPRGSLHPDPGGGSWTVHAVQRCPAYDGSVTGREGARVLFPRNLACSLHVNRQTAPLRGGATRGMDGFPED